MERKPVILHISDLHFGYDKSEHLDARELALNSLIGAIRNLEPSWHPTIVCLTGDIAMRGCAKDYRLASKWLRELLGSFCLPVDSLFICAGNHDVCQSKARGLARPGTPVEADRVLNFPAIAPHYAKIFADYSKWAREFGIPPYKLGGEESYLVGQRLYSGLSFIALNTCWCSQDTSDRGNLWVGLPQIRHLDNNRQFPHRQDRSTLPITITLMHHPSDWLDPHESNTYGPRPSTFEYINERSDILLSGHTHGGVTTGDGIAEGAWHLRAGATYAGADYKNHFRLIRLSELNFEYLVCQFDCNSAAYAWDPKPSRTLTFHKRVPLAIRTAIAEVTAEVSNEYGLTSEATDFLILSLAKELSDAQIELSEAKEKAEKLAQEYRESLNGLEEQSKRYSDFEGSEGE